MIRKSLIQLIKLTDLGSAVAVRLTKVMGKSKEPIHPKHFITKEPWFVNYLTKKDLVLDIGCGNGQNTLKAAVKVKSIIGIEYDEGLLKIANSTLNEIRVNNTIFKKMNIEDGLKFRNNSFTKIIFLDVLEHLIKRDFVLEEVKRVLKPGGKMFLGVPNGDTSWKKLQKKHGVCWFSDPDHKIEFSEVRIRRLLAKHGFTIIKFNYGTYDIPFRGIVDIVGGFSISLYKNISNYRKILGQKYPKEASGFEIIVQR